MKHTHRTDFVRNDYELAAIHVLLVMNGKEPNPSNIEDLEADHRGSEPYENSLRAMAKWLKEFRPDFVAEPHQCNGQMCDEDGKYDVSLVERKDL